MGGCFISVQEELVYQSRNFFVGRVWVRCMSVQSQKPNGHTDFAQANVELGADGAWL